MNAGVPEWLAVPVSLVTPIACVFNDQWTGKFRLFRQY
jgi:hypothetical protein